MKLVIPIFLACVFLFTSCAKEELDGFDSQITIASDFKVDPASGDTFYRFYMPSAFTPNDDGRNDLYIVYGQGWNLDEYKMKVFSREGNLVFSTSNPYHGFNGRVLGHSEISAQQVYTVDVKVMDTTGENHHYNYKIAALF